MKLRLDNSCIHNFWKHITIEPSIAVLYVSSVMENFLYTNLFLQKKCRRNATSEPDLRTPCDDEKAGQIFLTSINSWRLSAGLILMIIFTVFSSSWSDKAGRCRKPLLFIPMIGQTMVCIVGCLQSYFWQWPAISAAVLEPIIHGLTGGRFGVMYFSQIYICDITSNEDRTFRLGIIAAIAIISAPIGNGLCGFMLKYLGLFYSFSICTILTIIGIIMGILFIRDTSIPVEKKMSFWQMLNPTGVLESVKIVFKKRNYNKRTIIILLLFVDLLLWFSITGETAVFYLYLRYKFNWNETDYSIYVTYKLTLLFIGTLFSSFILSKFFKIHDGTIGVIAGSLSLVHTILYIFVNYEWQLYAVPVVGMLRAVLVITASSFQSKCLEKDEMGHLMSVRCLTALILPLCFPMYNYLYHKTLDTFPSAFFFISLAVNIPSVILFGIAYHLSCGTHIEPISTPCELPSTIQNTFDKSSKEN